MSDVAALGCAIFDTSWRTSNNSYPSRHISQPNRRHHELMPAQKAFFSPLQRSRLHDVPAMAKIFRPRSALLLGLTGGPRVASPAMADNDHARTPDRATGRRPPSAP